MNYSPNAQDIELIRKAADRAATELGVLHFYDPLQFVEIYKALSIVTGHDKKLMYHWFHTMNTHLKFIPLNVIHTEKGSTDIINYLHHFVHS